MTADPFTAIYQGEPALAAANPPSLSDLITVFSRAYDPTGFLPRLVGASAIILVAHYLVRVGLITRSDQLRSILEYGRNYWVAGPGFTTPDSLSESAQQAFTKWLEDDWSVYNRSRNDNPVTLLPDLYAHAQGTLELLQGLDRDLLGLGEPA